MRKYISAIILTTVLAAASCSNEKSVQPPSGDLTVKEEEGRVEVTSKDGSLSIAGNQESGHIKIKTGDGEDLELKYQSGKLSEDFPRDIPIYDPSEVTMSQAFKNGKNAIAALTTGEPADKVTEFYRTELPKQGWAVGGEMSIGGMVMLQGKKSGRLLNLSITKGDGTTSINLAMTEDTQ